MTSTLEELQELALADSLFDKALEAFDHEQQERYHMFVVSHDPLLEQVQALAWVLELRGAREIARRLKAAGLVTRDQLFATDLGEDSGRTFVIVQNFLTWLDREVRIEEAGILKLVLQGLAVGMLERKVNQEQPA